MARRASTSHYGCAMEERKKPSFFKMIKAGFNTKDLRIPPKFRKHIRNELSETATLELKNSPNRSWTVEVNQSGKEIYLKNGWKKFVKDNCLGDYEFLIFRYERNMHFSIEIFDKTACIRTHKVPRVRNNSGEDFEFPTFSITIRRTASYIAVPSYFCREYLPQGYYDIVLKNPEGREWKMGIVPSCTTVKLSGGWAAFKRDNNIKVGDICTFELVERDVLVFRIVRSDETD